MLNPYEYFKAYPTQISSGLSPATVSGCASQGLEEKLKLRKGIPGARYQVHNRECLYARDAKSEIWARRTGTHGKRGTVEDGIEDQILRRATKKRAP